MMHCGASGITEWAALEAFADSKVGQWHDDAVLD